MQYHSEKFRFTNLIAYYYLKLLNSHGFVLEDPIWGLLLYLTLLMEKNLSKVICFRSRTWVD